MGKFHTFKFQTIVVVRKYFQIENFPNYGTYIHTVYYAQSTDLDHLRFSAQTSDPSFCAVILGSRTQTSNSHTIFYDSQPNLRHLWQQTHNRSCILVACRAEMRALLIVGLLPRMAELLCMRDRLWLLCH